MTQDTPKRFFRIYGKAPSQASYKAMDLGEGVQTSNLIYATRPKPSPAWSWQIREVK